MSRLGLLSFSLLASVAVACSFSGTDKDAVDLINGQVENGEYPSSLILADSCTAAKVGPRQILTAAHCVNRGRYGVGTTFKVTGGSLRGAVVSKTGGTLQLTVEKVGIPQRRRELCPLDESCMSIDDLEFNASPDVAVIVTREEITGIPMAAVDLDPVQPNDEVIVLGSGCEDYVSTSPFDYSKRRMKFQKAKALFPEAVFHKGSYFWRLPGDPNANLASFAESYFVTPGPDMESGAVGLCPGDSGGPVYRAGKQNDAIVGVNATYTFRDQADNLSPMTNGHTRVDSQSHWLTNFFSVYGVNTVHSCSTFRSCAPPEPHSVGPLVPPTEDIPVEPPSHKDDAGTDEQREAGPNSSDASMPDAERDFGSRDAGRDSSVRDGGSRLLPARRGR